MKYLAEVPAAIGSDANLGWKIGCSALVDVSRKLESEFDEQASLEVIEAIILTLETCGYLAVSPPRTAREGDES